MYHMIQNYSIWKVLRVFFDDPQSAEGFTIRWISKAIGLAATSVKIHLDELSREDKEGFPLVVRTEGRSYPVYRAKRESELFRFYKKMDVIFRLEETGLIEFLERELSPDAIVLFGSASRGDDISGSDIDLYVQCNEKRMYLDKYEDVLKRKIELHFSDSFKKLPKELGNNIINGTVLSGYLKVS